MPTIRPNKDDLARARRKTDWRRLDKLSDRAIKRAVAGDADAAPDMSSELQKGVFCLVEPRRG
ncbi:MAG: hypothetical protein ACREB6_12215 [Rhodospirillales bacterium]